MHLHESFDRGEKKGQVAETEKDGKFIRVTSLELVHGSEKQKPPAKLPKSFDTAEVTRQHVRTSVASTDRTLAWSLHHHWLLAFLSSSS